MEIGRYVQYCWLAEEHARVSNPALTEEELFYLWDECNEAQFEDMCVKGRQVLDDYAKRKNVAVIRAALRRKLAPVKWLIAIVSFCAREMAAGFVGAIGLLVFGLLLLWLQPDVVTDMRGILDRLLPTATQPERSTTQPAAANTLSTGG